MKKSLVIGGTRGIGGVIASQLERRGDQVYTASRRKLENPLHIAWDIGSSDPAELIEPIGKLNYLVFAHRYRGESLDEELNIMLKRLKVVIEAFQPHFAQEAAIVALGSNAGHFIISEQSAMYHARQAGLQSLMRYYAVCLGQYGIRCHCVLPTTIIKPENQNFFREDNQVRQLIEKITPLKRMGKAEDIADMVEFLCSEKSSFITGQSFLVDGGVSLVGHENLARELLNVK